MSPGLRALYHGSAIYHLLLSGHSPRELAMKLDPWPGDAAQGEALLAGEVLFPERDGARAFAALARRHQRGMARRSASLPMARRSRGGRQRSGMGSGAALDCRMAAAIRYLRPARLAGRCDWRPALRLARIFRPARGRRNAACRDAEKLRAAVAPPRPCRASRSARLAAPRRVARPHRRARGAK